MSFGNCIKRTAKYHNTNVIEVLLAHPAPDDAQEGGGGVVGDRLAQERLARAGRAVEDDVLGRLDVHLLVALRVGEGQLDALLDLLVEAADVGVGLLRRLLQLHDGDHGVGVVAEDADDRVDLVVEENGAAWLELVLVDEGEDGDVVLAALRGGDDGVRVVDDLLEGAGRHGRAAQLVLLPLLHDVLGERAGLAGEDVLDLAQPLVEVGRPRVGVGLRLL